MKQMNKKLVSGLGVASLVISAMIPSSLFAKDLPRSGEMPNVVMIVVDDLGWMDVGYNNSAGVFETPNINRLAERSLNFDNAYAGAANCAPSRAVLMSGQYAPRQGIYTVSPSARGHQKTRKLIPIKNTDILADDIVTLAETMRNKGYTTGHFGKWHLGDDPTTQGFDYNVAGNLKGHPTSYFSPYNLRHLVNGPKGEYLTNRITTEVIRWMENVKAKQQPFFAYIPYYAVHTPLQAIAEVQAKYQNKPGIRNENHAAYAAMVEIMDNNVGRILNTLADNQLTDNTLVIFTSDNGGIRSIAYQDPLRGGKGSYYEGGVRVPLLISWGNKINPGINHTPVINADFYPTLAAITAAKLPNQPLDGVDLSPILFTQQAIKPRALYWHFPIYLQSYNPAADQSRDPLFRTRPGSAMRLGQWKLHHYFEDNSYELYNLADDLGEHVNLAPYLPAKLAELKQKLSTWQTQISAPIPTQVNPKYDHAAELIMLEEKYKKKLTQFEHFGS